MSRKVTHKFWGGNDTFVVSWTRSYQHPKGGSFTARPTSMKARRRYNAVSEAVFLAKERDQLQPLAPASTKPSDSPSSADSVTAPESQSGFRRARSPLGDEGDVRATTETAPTVGRRPRTPSARGGSVSETARTYPAAATKSFRTSVSRGVWMVYFRPSRLSRFVSSSTSYYLHARLEARHRCCCLELNIYLWRL